MLLIGVLLPALLAAAPQALGNFKVIVIPDTQNESTWAPEMFTAQTQWIVDNKSDIAFVAHVGDVVNTCTNSAQYNNADAAMDLLDNGNVPYGVSPGNHDQPNSGACGDTSRYPSYFGTTRFAGKSYYGGVLDDYNHYFFFSAGGMDFIIIFLQYNPGTVQLDWADARMKENPHRRAIVVSHNMLNLNDTWSNSSIYESLKDNPNLFLLLCGHNHSISEGEALITANYNGTTVHAILSDYQDFEGYTGGGWLRILEFTPSTDLIAVTAYSPYMQATGSSFTLSYNMPYLYGDHTTPADCDVDGSDLADLTANSSMADLADFAENFGKSACL